MARKRQTGAGNPAAGQVVVAPPAARPGRVRVRLDSVGAILAEMGRVYRAMRAQTIVSGDGTRLVYVLATMAKLHADHLFDERLQRLEAHYADRQAGINARPN